MESILQGRGERWRVSYMGGVSNLACKSHSRIHTPPPAPPLIGVGSRGEWLCIDTTEFFLILKGFDLRNKYRQTGRKAAGNRELSYELLPFAYAQTTVCVCPNNRSRTPKQPFGYTQTLLLNFFEGHPGGTLGAHFLAYVPPNKHLIYR